MPNSRNWKSAQSLSLPSVRSPSSRGYGHAARSFSRTSSSLASSSSASHLQLSQPLTVNSLPRKALQRAISAPDRTPLSVSREDQSHPDEGPASDPSDKQQLLGLMNDDDDGSMEVRRTASWPSSSSSSSTWNRPWRKAKSSVDAERAEIDRILVAESGTAGLTGVDVPGLLFCMLAQECLDELAMRADSGGINSPTAAVRIGAQAAVDGLRQVSTNAAGMEAVDASRAAVVEALEAIGLGDALRSRLKRPNVGKYDTCHMVLPGLWLGGWTALNNHCEELRRRKVTHVVSVVSTNPRTDLPSFIRGHLHILAHDSEEAAADLSAHFPAVCRFVDAARNEPRGCVYIHCGAGISRAPTVVASYLMWKLGIAAAGALRLIKQARSNIRPNVGFVKQLRNWEVEMLALPGCATLNFTDQRRAGDDEGPDAGLLQASERHEVAVNP